MIGLVGIVAIIEGSQTAGTVAGATFSAIASVVGAFFGVKVGSEGTKSAIRAQRQEAARAQVFAANVSSDDAKVIVDAARAAAANVPPER